MTHRVGDHHDEGSDRDRREDAASQVEAGDRQGRRGERQQDSAGR
jgi:hypothetical protein